MAKILIDRKGNRYLWVAGDLHTLFGVLKKEEIENNKTGKILSHINKEFIIFDASFSDEILGIKQNTAKMHLKDIGCIISTTGISNKSKIIDAGTGTGLLAAFLANISQNVTTYEKDPEVFNNAKKNFEKLGIKIKSKNKDITEGIEEKDLDLITLDMLEPHLVLSHVEKSLKSGGYLVVYLPNITQISNFIKESKNYKFVHEKTIEILEREWLIEDLRTRPKNQMLGHTAFLTFLRKY